MPETTPQPTPVTRALADYFSVQAKPKSLFLGPPMGLIENMDNSHPAIWDLYKKLKSMDWDETEIDISSCREEFKTRPPEAVRLMISTLAFQFEADSNAAHIARLMYPFINNTELMCYITELAKNECLTPDHEVLTPDGWKRIDQVTTDDKVAQWDRESFEISFVKPTEVIKKHHSGLMYHFLSERGNVDQIVTPDHRMPVIMPYWFNGRHDWMFAKDLKTHGGNALPTSGYIHSEGRRMTAAERLYVAVQADGSLCSEKYNGERSGKLHYTFGFKKQRKIDRLYELCKHAGWTVTEDCVGSTELDGVRYFRVHTPVEEYNWRAKTFDWFKLDEISRHWAEDFIDELQYWDGNLTKDKRIRYINSNKKAVDKVVALGHIVGQRAHVTVIPAKKQALMPGGKRCDTKQIYQVHFTERMYTVGNAIDKFETDYEGYVYCLRVPTSFFMVRRNNAVSVTGNCLHALSYKFIVESSFEDPNDFLKEVREIKEAFLRLDNVNTIFQELLEVGAKYTLGMITDEAAIRKLLLKAWVSLYALERIQFISSFAVTFSLAEQGLCESMFVPIAKLVQKISTDEWNIHVDADKAVLRNELSIPDVFALWLEILPEVQAIVDSVVAAEVKWLTDYLFKDSNVTVGIERDSIIAFVQYTAQDVYDFLKLPITWARHTTNPLPLMEKWLSIDNNQASPQEESIGNYLLGGLIDDTDTVNANRYAGLGVKL